MFRRSLTRQFLDFIWPRGVLLGAGLIGIIYFMMRFPISPDAFQKPPTQVTAPTSGAQAGQPVGGLPSLVTPIVHEGMQGLQPAPTAPARENYALGKIQPVAIREALIYTERIAVEDGVPHAALRSQPDVSTAPIAYVGSTDTLGIILEQGDWYLVQIVASTFENGKYINTEGWILKWIVTGQNIPPVPTPAPATAVPVATEPPSNPEPTATQGWLPEPTIEQSTPPPSPAAENPTVEVPVEVTKLISSTDDGSCDVSQFLSSASGKVMNPAGMPLGGFNLQVKSEGDFTVEVPVAADGTFNTGNVLGCANWRIEMNGTQVFAPTHLNGKADATFEVQIVLPAF